MLGFGSRATEAPKGSAEFVNSDLPQVPALARAAGAKLLLYPSPPLDRPFTKTAASPPDWQAAIIGFARAHEIPVYPLQRGLVDQDYRKLRLDPCCHFNAAGHRALVPVMERLVLQQLDGDGRPSDLSPPAHRPF